MAPKQAEKLARKSRYIEGLLDKAKERAREQDIIYERTCGGPLEPYKTLEAPHPECPLHRGPAGQGQGMRAQAGYH